jgi:uncharacterized protein (DUF736 family)
MHSAFIAIRAPVIVEVNAMARKLYLVQADGPDWIVMHEGREIGRSWDRGEVESAARRLAQRDTPSVLRVLKGTGRFDFEDTFGEAAAAALR